MLRDWIIITNAIPAQMDTRQLMALGNADSAFKILLVPWRDSHWITIRQNAVLRRWLMNYAYYLHSVPLSLASTRLVTYLPCLFLRCLHVARTWVRVLDSVHNWLVSPVSATSKEINLWHDWGSTVCRDREFKLASWRAYGEILSSESLPRWVLTSYYLFLALA